MADFSELIDKAKKRSKAKLKGGRYGTCDYCDRRLPVFEYEDSKEERWDLCEECINLFVDEEVDE